MDEVFGRKNFVSLIPFRTTSGFESKTISRSGDYLVWYGKNKSNLKYRELYEDKPFSGSSKQGYKMLELKDGSRLSIHDWEKQNGRKFEYNNRPEGSKVLTLGDLTARGGDKECPVKFGGKTYTVNKGKHWKARYPEGMDRLIALKRVECVGNTLRYVRYFDDFSKQRVDNFWSSQLSEQNKIYVVQTSEKVIERCILMTTDPGDLVLDPTCGSGTTAYVAEQWGRRWITCDTSRVAITLAKQRLVTAVFDYYKLENVHEGVSSGFQYEKVPHITLGSIANNEPAKEETLYDKPLKDKKKVRVTAPFTIEAVPSQSVQSLNSETRAAYKYEWLDEVRRSGIRGKKGITTDMKFVRLEVVKGFKYLHAEGETDNPRRVVMSFGSEYAPLDKRQVETALQEAKSLCPDVLVFVAFQFDAEAARLIETSSNDKIKVAQVQMNMDLQTKDLKKKTSTNESFWLLGQPDIKVEKSENNKYVVHVRGWDYYDPVSGAIKSGGKDKVAMWLLDTDYDGKAVFPKQVFFPMADKKEGWTKLAKSLKSEIDEKLVESYRRTKSLPFEAGEHKKIAVKIIDDRGIESLKTIDLAKHKRAA